MQSTTLTLSIVIPVYNEEYYLASCLDLIAAQTVKPKQVIVVDNGSTDQTTEIAKRYDFVTLIHEPKRGVAYARDRGFNAVTADLIGRIDADTHVPLDWVEGVVALFATEPQMGAVSGPTGCYDLPGHRATLRLTKIIRTTLFYVGHRASKYLYGANMAVRTSAWKCVTDKMCYVAGTHEDNDLAIHLEDEKQKVHYNNSLTAMVSCRRADVGPRKAWTYAFMESATFRDHGMFCIQAYLAGIIIIGFYPAAKLLRRAYDHENGRYSLQKFRHYQPNPRPQPME